MPISLNDFRQVAQLDVNRLTQNVAGDQLVQAPRGFFGRIAYAVTGPSATEGQANQAVIQNLRQALVTGYGNAIADAAMHGIDATQDLSSRNIKTVLDTAARLGHEQRLTNQALISQFINPRDPMSPLNTIFSTHNNYSLQDLSPKDQRALQNQVLNQLMSDTRFSREPMTPHDITQVINATVRDFQEARHSDFETNKAHLEAHFRTQLGVAKPSIDHLNQTVATWKASVTPAHVQAGNAMETAMDHLDHNVELLSECPIGQQAVDQHVLAIQNHILDLNQAIADLGNLQAGSPDPALVQAMIQDIQDQVQVLNTQVQYLNNFKNANPISDHEIVEARCLHRDTALRLIDDALQVEQSKPLQNQDPNKIQRLMTLATDLALDSANERGANPARDNTVSDDDIRTRLGDYQGQLQRQLREAGVPGRNLKEHYLDAQAELLNQQPWDTIGKTIRFVDGNVQHTYQSTLTPAAQMRISDPTPGVGGHGQRDLFPTSYNGQGVAAHASSETTHASNLYASEFRSSTGTVLYQGVRHAIHSAYGLDTGATRDAGNLNRARESILAALALKPQLMQQALAGQTVTFRTTSTSLVTPDAFRRGHSDEALMLREQVAAFAELSDPANQPLTLNVIDDNGNPRQIQVKLDVATFNFGVNAGAVNWYSPLVGGWTQSHGVNEEGMKKLLGSTDPSKPLGGWVEAHLAEHPTDPNNRHILELSQQIREMYTSGSHRSQEHDTYKMAARLLLLTHLLEGVPLSNCKSGKDRTGMLDAEVKFLAHQLEATGEVPKPGQPLTPEQSRIFREIAMNAGNLEVQKQNTGIGGYKTEGVDSISERVGDDDARRIVRGGSKAVKT
ncbi:MAG TPA: inositol phosphate phosphatase SopB [Candidatus Competibacteraceae bacterium]|nr:inositol phosphate phosphatase SopB [Candidatus Competibacteraceae bacterium]HQA24748.1 inositol phosphate phosphatase SopB [Candidatus Competibacteraceae bacterium]HQD55498.1 inositol phosphate phosphatase SopB [Candidatus Competibacteraceae bacterium]